jgi:hypothetical protein
MPAVVSRAAHARAVGGEGRSVTPAAIQSAAPSAAVSSAGLAGDLPDQRTRQAPNRDGSAAPVSDVNPARATSENRAAGLRAEARQRAADARMTPEQLEEYWRLSAEDWPASASSWAGGPGVGAIGRGPARSRRGARRCWAARWRRSGGGTQREIDRRRRSRPAHMSLSPLTSSVDPLSGSVSWLNSPGDRRV